MTPQEAYAELIAVQSQRISDLEAQLAECCEARTQAEIQAVEMARLVQRAIAYQQLMSRLSANECMGDSQYQVAQAIIDQYTKEQP